MTGGAPILVKMQDGSGKFCLDTRFGNYDDITSVNQTLCRSQFHPKPSPLGQIPGHDLKEAKPSPPRDNHCVQKRSPRDKTGSQKPHPWDIKLENFSNVSINSDTIRNEKLCGLNK